MVDTKETHVWLTWLAPAGNLGGTGTPGGGFVVGGTPTTDSPPPPRVTFIYIYMNTHGSGRCEVTPCPLGNSGQLDLSHIVLSTFIWTHALEALVPPIP